MSAKLPKRVVIDASVALKWYLPEEDSTRALVWYCAIRDRKIFAIAPDYLLFECANVLLKRHRVKPEYGKAIINDLGKLSIELIHLSTLRIDSVITLSDKYHTTVYDAIYLELARLTQTKLVTADALLLKNAKKLTIKL